MKVIAGAGGHIGGALTDAWAARVGSGMVRAIHRTGCRAAAGLDIDWVKGDILDRSSLVAAFADGTVVYPLAALVSIDPDRVMDLWTANVAGRAMSSRPPSNAA